MRVVDSIIALRIVYLLTVPFNKTDAYKLGLIDENGNKIKNAETSDEKNATSMLHRLVWNIKKVFALVPGGKTRIGSLVAAYMLVRESHEMKLSEEDSLKYFNENFDKVWNLPFEEREWVEDAITTLIEDAPANATGAEVSTNTPTVKRGRTGPGRSGGFHHSSILQFQTDGLARHHWYCRLLLYWIVYRVEL